MRSLFLCPAWTQARMMTIRSNYQKGNIMSSNQRDQGSKQSGQQSTTADKGNLRPDQQSANKGSQQQGGQQQGGQQQGGQQQGGQQRGNQQQQGNPGQRQSTEQDMDDDTGLSNKTNRQSSELDQGSRQSKQSNVGRRDDGTPD